MRCEATAVCEQAPAWPGDRLHPASRRWNLEHGHGGMKQNRSVECLGRSFATEGERRRYFLRLLAEKLADPEFRASGGFPKGTEEDLLEMSDPPYYTACPNPFLTEFVAAHGRPFDPAEDYQREPFAADVSEGKTDQLYRAHGYHTKVPASAIVPFILHYTRPGDLVLDAFCGSGMTGVAVQQCPGSRRAILGDLGPAATFIAANYNLPFAPDDFEAAARELLESIESECAWMYETRAPGGEPARIDFTVWSQVFGCPACSGEVVFLEQALEPATRKTRQRFACPHCGASVTKSKLERLFDTLADPGTGAPWRRIRLRPVLTEYTLAGARHRKAPDPYDEAVLRRAQALPLPAEVPTNPFPIDDMYHGSRLGPKGFTHTHHLFLPRAAQALAALWRRATRQPDRRLRNMLLFYVEQAIWGMSVLARYAPTHFSQVNQQLNGVYYVGSQIVEVSPWYILRRKLARLRRAFTPMPVSASRAAITTGDCGHLPLPTASVDYVFTDPPFGGNIYYADLNFLVESWHRVHTDSDREAILDLPKQKGIQEYRVLMEHCFREYHRVLKPGRWMTVVFSNSDDEIWRAFQAALGTAGFVVADVRTLRKQQGSFRQVTSSAVKQDLVISAHRPLERDPQRFSLGAATTDGVWAFVDEYLGSLPVVVGPATPSRERTAQMLHDRMIARFVARRVGVPMSSAAFFAGLAARYPQRDGNYFLPGQLSELEASNRSRKTRRRPGVTDPSRCYQSSRSGRTRKTRG